MADFYRDLVAILREHGCKLVRQGKGSHGHTANEVLKQAGLPKAF
jgi:Holliday junction resolvase